MIAIGHVLQSLGIAVGIVFGLWAAYIDFKILVQVAGFWGVVLGIFIPVIIPAVPIYALIKWGDWLPILVNYGGLLITIGLFGLGHLITKQNDT